MEDQRILDELNAGMCRLEAKLDVAVTQHTTRLMS
jgi:hypothetical protein